MTSPARAGRRTRRLVHPWGDPDLQGTYTNKYEQSTPLERPDQFAGRRVEDVSGAELADVLAKRDKQVVERSAGVGPLQFRDPLEVTKGSRAWLIVDPPDGKVPPMTPAARQRIGPPDPFQDTGIQGIVNARVREASSFDPNSSFRSIDDFDLWERCITRGVPGAMMPHILGNSYEIVQAPGLVAIRYELVHDVRIIPLDGSAHLTKAFELEMGDARGHWDGAALVVESTNYKDRSAYRNANAATLRLIERFTRTSANRIEWSVTVNDPATWTKPWTFSMPLTKTDARARARVRVSRGQLRVAAHPQRCARGGGIRGSEVKRLREQSQELVDRCDLTVLGDELEVSRR